MDNNNKNIFRQRKTPYTCKYMEFLSQQTELSTRKGYVIQDVDCMVTNHFNQTRLIKEIKFHGALITKAQFNELRRMWQAWTLLYQHDKTLPADGFLGCHLIQFLGAGVDSEAVLNMSEVVSAEFLVSLCKGEIRRPSLFDLWDYDSALDAGLLWNDCKQVLDPFFIEALKLDLAV